MLSTKKIAVAVDLSDSDKTVLQYTKHLADRLKVEKVNLIHVIPGMLSPRHSELSVYQYLGLEFDIKGIVKDRLQKAGQAFFNNGISFEVDVVEGKPYRQLMTYADNLDSDLLVVGVKSDSGKSGITAQKVVRNFEGSVLFVPEDVTMEVAKIAVPMDFSDNSARALKTALSMAKKMENCSVRCIHAINSVPSHYFFDQKLKSDLNRQLLSLAENAWEMFLEKNDLEKEEISIDYRKDVDLPTEKLLLDYFENENIDLVVMGAKGHSVFENFLYGSVTEELVEACNKRSVLVIR